MSVLLKLPHSNLQWIREGKILLKTIEGICSGPELQILFNAGYEKVMKEEGVKWLSDNRRVRPYADEDVQWINENWLPRMLKIGWKYWGHVEPVTALGSINMKNFDFYKDRGLIVETFKSLEDGIAWLQSVDSEDS